MTRGGGEGVGPNRLAEGDGYWNGVGGVEDVGWRDDKWVMGKNSAIRGMSMV